MDTTEVEGPQEFFGVEPVHLRRVTVVCGEFCTDLAAPSDQPLSGLAAEMAGLFLERARPMARDRGTSPITVLCGEGPRGRWQLSRRIGGPLDPDSTLAASGVHDGETLVLAAPPLPTVPPLWDDSLVAISERTRQHMWGPAESRRMGTAALGLVALVLVAVLTKLLFRDAGIVVSGIAAVCAVTVASIASITRAHGASAATGTFGIALTSIFFGLVGAGAIPGQPEAPHVLAFGVGAAIAGMLAGSLLPRASDDALLSERAAGTVLGLLGTVTAAVAALCEWTTMTVVQGGVSVLALGVAVVVASPMIAVGLGRVRLPAATTTDADASGPLDLAQVHAQAAAARRALVHSAAAGGLLCVGGVVILCTQPDPSIWAWLLSACTTAFLLVRPRTVLERGACLCLLTTGFASALALIAAAFGRADSTLALIVSAAGTLALAAIVALAGWWIPDREFTPPLRRTVDIVDALLIAALPPLMLVAAGIVQAIRG